jgi:thiol-disulfide isomerase/thioredoxin
MQGMTSDALRRTTRRGFLAGAAAAGSVAAGLWPMSAKAGYMVKPWPEGKPPPALGLADLDGKRWELSSLAGHAVVLNFWASWCEPCRAEMPSLELLATRYESDGLTVLSVNYKESLPTIQRFLEALPFTLPILLDRDGATATAWTPRVFPTTVLIDRAGMPRQSVLGELEWNGAAARALVEPLLTKPKKA